MSRSRYRFALTGHAEWAQNLVAAGGLSVIQVYDAEIAEPGVFNLMIHTNFTPIGRTAPDYAGAIIPNHSVNGAAEWAYGVTDLVRAGTLCPCGALLGRARRDD